MCRLGSGLLGSIRDMDVMRMSSESCKGEWEVIRKGEKYDQIAFTFKIFTLVNVQGLN